MYDDAAYKKWKANKNKGGYFISEAVARKMYEQVLSTYDSLVKSAIEDDGKRKLRKIAGVSFDGD